MLLSRSNFTATKQIKGKRKKKNPESMKVNGLPRGFAKCPAPYLAKCWSLVQGGGDSRLLSQARHGNVLISGCPRSWLQPVAQVSQQACPFPKSDPAF